jgi:hypothetical protein
VGSVKMGEPWRVTLPTDLVVLSDQLAALPQPK